jgi:hypothetical protein
LSFRCPLRLLHDTMRLRGADMDMKPVELQIAVPRTTEASKVQQDYLARHGAEQQLLAGQNMKESEHRRIRSHEVDDSPKSEWREEGRSSFSDSKEPSNQEQEHEAHVKEKPQPAEHPYKGKHIDLSL